MTFLESLMLRAGDTGPAPEAVLPRMGPRAAISYSGEFRRIEALPRRRWEEDDKLSQIVELLTEEFRLPDGRMRLWKIQATALRDIVMQKGAFLPVGVGQGKALISLLAPVALQSTRPVLFVPAALREQTLRYVIPRMSEHWRLHPGLRVIGYSELSLAKNARMLEELQPDLIIFDECHAAKNLKAGRTRRLVRYFREHPETMCVAMSGTISNRSIRDFAHIIRWCLKNQTPVPEKWTELTEWADALDEKVPDEQRVAPGALQRFCKPGENARQGFRRRLTETPGVVATKENLLGTSLRVLPFAGLAVPREVERLAHLMRSTWVTPDGDIITEAIELWRHMRELALGFYYKWSPAAPKEWLEARSTWKKYVREVLKHNQRQLDTELQVWNECEHNKQLPEDHPWRAWLAIKDTFKPKLVAEWVDDFAVQACCRWLDSCTDEAPGICWVEQRAFGTALADLSGRPYFEAGNDDILSCEAPAIIASQSAHSEGKNLQRYCRALVTSPMASGKSWEQAIGRLHREGQQADEVTFEVFVHMPELLNSFGQALSDARYLEDTFGNKQKLCYCDLGDFGVLRP